MSLRLTFYKMVACEIFLILTTRSLLWCSRGTEVDEEGMVVSDSEDDILGAPR